MFKNRSLVMKIREELLLHTNAPPHRIRDDLPAVVADMARIMSGTNTLERQNDELVGRVEALRELVTGREADAAAARQDADDLRAKLDRYKAVVRIGDRRIARRSGSEVEVVSIDLTTDSIGVRFINPYNERTPHRWFTRARVAGWDLA